MKIEEFAERFDALRKQGFIKTQRRGPTGIGYTLETLLDIEENNIALPDLHEVELKASRSCATTRITLYTLDRGAWIMKPHAAITKYGTADRNLLKLGRLGLYFTMSATKGPNSAGLMLSVDDERAVISHESGEEIAHWKLEALAQKFMEKMPSLLLVSADTKTEGGVEYFHFNRATLLSNSSPELFREQLANGNVEIDLRLHDRGTSARNHGTGFRAFERNLPLLFKDRKEL